MHQNITLAQGSIPKKIDLNAIKAPVKQDLLKIDSLITEKLRDKLGLIQAVCEYIINSGGKRVRPLLLVLAAKAFDYHGNKHIKLATIMEFLHTATLLHDDVIDHSKLRRHRQTANIVWDNETSILVGDFLHALSFQMMVELGDTKVMEVIASATTAIVTGEVMQLIHRNTLNTSREKYMEMISKKTARLFTVAAQLGGIICDRPEKDIQHLAEYGLYLGIAYQLIDDALDYTASPDVLGKNIGDDLAEGKATLPLIYAMQKSTPIQAKIIQDALSSGGYKKLDHIIEIIESTKALEHTKITAQKYIDKAMDCLHKLADVAYCDSLCDLTQFVINRAY